MQYSSSRAMSSPSKARSGSRSSALSGRGACCSEGAACSENSVSCKARAAPCAPVRTGLRYSGASENAPAIAVHATSGETAACTRMHTSAYRPYVPMSGASPPRSPTALLTAAAVAPSDSAGSPPMAKQSNSPRQPMMLSSETTRSSSRPASRHSKVSRMIVVSSVCPAKRSRISACSLPAMLPSVAAGRYFRPRAHTAFRHVRAGVRNANSAPHTECGALLCSS
ncbi:hypothetical protein BPSP_1592 [Bifidobacterium pseudolongum subsp. pseudolongum]|nr:hypothetical protein BPSP_1592 [Bifidobacterium pseudolongum subsp. pseudolongum]